MQATVTPPSGPKALQGHFRDIPGALQGHSTGSWSKLLRLKKGCWVRGNTADNASRVILKCCARCKMVKLLWLQTVIISRTLGSSVDTFGWCHIWRNTPLDGPSRWGRRGAKGGVLRLTPLNGQERSQRVLPLTQHPFLSRINLLPLQGSL